MGVPVPGWSEPAGAPAGRTQAGADAGGLWGAARRAAPVAGVSAQPGRKPERLGRTAGRSLPARLAGRETGFDPDRWLRGIGGGDSDGLSASAASALLGAQDAQHPGTRAQARLRRSETGSAGHLSRREPASGRSRLPRLPSALAARLRSHGATPGTRSAGAAVVLQLPPALVEEAAYHQRDRTLFRGGAAPHPAHGLLCEREKRGPNYLLHLPALYPGMENPHPQAIYTSRVTSPWNTSVALPTRSFVQPKPSSGRRLCLAFVL